MIRTTVSIPAVAGLAAATAAPAGAADRGNNPFEAATDAYRAAYPKLTDAQARAAAAGSDARRTIYDAAAADAPTFGGAWYDAQTNTVHLAGTTDAAVARGAALGRQYGVAVKPYKVARSAA